MLIKDRFIYREEMWTVIRENLGPEATGKATIGTVVEVGSRMGHWTYQLLERFLVDRVFCIDIWPKHKFAKIMPGWFELMDDRAFKTVFPLRGESVRWGEILPFFPIDLLYIDGNHHKPQVMLDLRWWWPRLCSGGLLIMHDASSVGVREAVHEFFGEDDVRLEHFKSGPDRAKAFWLKKK